jgi:aspartyl/asparaginyl beta-hydroxylase (cupin superfamily)
MFKTNYKEYSKYKILEDNYKLIAEEIPKFNLKNINIERSHGTVHLETWSKSKEGAELLKKLGDNNAWLKVSQVCGDDVHDWYNYTVMINNLAFGNAENICPNTIKFLKTLGTINLAGFSLMTPRGKIPPHTDCTGPTYQSMACNLNLTGTDSDLFVLENNKMLKHHHKKGVCVFFNSENTHWVENNSDEQRVILYLEISIKDNIKAGFDLD